GPASGGSLGLVVSKPRDGRRVVGGVQGIPFPVGAVGLVDHVRAADPDREIAAGRLVPRGATGANAGAGLAGLPPGLREHRSIASAPPMPGTATPSSTCDQDESAPAAGHQARPRLASSPSSSACARALTAGSATTPPGLCAVSTMTGRPAGSGNAPEACIAG